MKIKSIELCQLDGKHYSTDVVVLVEVGGQDYNFGVSVCGYAPNASRREIEAGWEPEWGMDHVESETHLLLAEAIVEALKKL